eukprot:scaffold2179_cov312-Prasinococcus_capsulatus_cf.AAC.1
MYYHFVEQRCGSEGRCIVRQLLRAGRRCKRGGTHARPRVTLPCGAGRELLVRHALRRALRLLRLHGEAVAAAHQGLRQPRGGVPAAAELAGRAGRRSGRARPARGVRMRRRTHRGHVTCM